MKRKLTALLLAASMIASMVPAVGAASSVPNEFYKQVGLELMPARTQGLYDEPVHPQPDVDESGFVRKIEGWTPAPVESGLPVAVTKAEEGAVKIATAEDLQAIKTGGSYVLTEDIDLTGIEWMPKRISGGLTLDGQGHTIKGLTIKMEETAGYGLFASVGGAFTVKNLRLDEAEMDMAIASGSQYSFIGTLAGDANDTTLQNIVVNTKIIRTVDATPYIGGLLGYVNGKLTVSDCAFHVSIERAEGVGGISSGVMAGLVREVINGSASLERMYAKVSIDGAETVGCTIGGLCARVVPEIRDSWIETELNGEDHNLGSIISWCSGGPFVMDNCVVNSSITGGGNLGGIAGQISHFTQLKLTDCRINTDLTLTGKANGGGIAGNVDQCGSEITGCAVDTVIKTEGQDRQTTAIAVNAGGMFGRSYRGEMNVASCDVRADVDDLVAGNGTAGGLSGELGWFNFRDTFVDFSANGTTMRTAMHIGGMSGYSEWTGTIQNCGVKVNLCPDFTQGCLTSAAGMIGFIRGVDIARSYVSGKIEIDTSGLETYSGSINAGGMTGGTAGSVTQCYGGADVAVTWDGPYNAEVAGIAGRANALISTWSDATISSDNVVDVKRSNVGGLAAGANMVQDCCFVGEIPVSDAASVGGISSGGSGSSVMRNSYATADVGGASDAGGLVGSVGATASYSFYDCWYEGNVSGSSIAGGIVGNASGGNLYRCDASGNVSAPDGTAGGVAGNANRLEDCSFNGSVGGANVGGVAGDGDVCRSTFRGNLKIELIDTLYSNVGGISASSGWIEDCHVLTPISVTIGKKGLGTTDSSGSGQYTYQYIGGIGGSYTGTVLNCTTRGIAVHSERDIGSYILYLGGVAPGRNSRVTAENCKINGKVSYTGEVANVYMGGILGFGMNDGFGKPKAVVKNCVVNGTVSVRLDPSESSGNGMITVGGLVGDARETQIDGSYHNGAVHASSSNPYTGIGRKDPLVGTGDYALTNVPGAAGTTRDDENYIVRTYWHDQSGLAMFPLAGAEVAIDGAVVGITGEDGSLTVSGSAVSDRSMVIVSAAAEGYFEASTVDFLCHGGSVDLILKKKEEGKIYLTSALIETGENEMQEMLYSKNSVEILQDTQSPQHYYFGVDWNDTQTAGRKLQLVDKDGNDRVDLTAGIDLYFQLPKFFEPNEEIYLKATGLKADETITETQARLPLRVKELKPHVNLSSDQAPLGKTDSREGLDFLEGVSFGVDFGDICNGYGAEISFKNNVLKVDFDKGRSEDLKKAKGLINGKTRVSVGGKLEIAFQDGQENEWSGEVKVTAALDPLFEHKKLLLMAGPVPISGTSEIGIETSAGLGLEGTLSDPKFYGRMGAEGQVEVMIGVGGSVDLAGNMVENKEDDDLTVMLGPSIGAEGGFDVFLEPLEESGGHIDAELEGDLTFKLKAKAGSFVEIDPAVQIGAFTWNNKEGARFTSPLIDDDRYDENGAGDGGGRSIQWIPDTQSYLASGGGFITVPLRNPAALYAWNGMPVVDGEQANVAQLYENIVQDSTGALTVENGDLVLWFTADDGNRELDGNAAEHTAVWRSICTDGVWSEPVVVSGSENGYPDNVCADGPAAVWVESTKTDSLEELLSSTQIKVAVNGKVFHTIETGGHAYNAKVSAADDGSNILVSWFSAPEVNSLESMLSAKPALCYARYADGVWSQGTVPTGEKIPVDATPVYAEPIIAWKDTSGQQYRNARTDFTYNAVWIADLARAEHNGNFTAEMEEDGTLVIWEGTTGRAKLQTGSAGYEAPLLLDDGNGIYYAVWTENDGIYYADSASGWAYAKPICALEQQIMGLSGAIVDGLPVVTYYQTDYNKDKTDFIYHLYIAQAPNLSGADLSVGEVTLDDEGVGETGLMTVSAEVVNCGEAIVTGYAYTVTDETGKEYFTGTISDVSLGYGDADLCHALIAVDVSAQHTYTVTVTAEGDGNGSNNAGSVTAQSEAELASAAFSLMPSGEIGLKAVASNVGGAPLKEMAVAVYRCNSDGTLIGDVLAEESFVDVLPGSYRQLMLDEAVMDTLYKVVLTSGGEEVDSQMLMWSDPEVSGAWITGVDISEDGQAKVKLSAQNWTEDLVLHLAVYQDGRMVANEMETLSAWSGSKSLDFDFAEALTGGEYTYSAFLLKKDGLVPVAKKLSGSVSIP